MIRRLFGTIILSALLAACASTPRTLSELPPRPPRDAIAAFAFDGRAVVRQGGKADTLRLSWRHSAQGDDIGFAGPLGNTMAELQSDATGARWTTANGESVEAGSPDILIARLTDMPVPVDALALWVTGRVRSGASDIERDASGRLTQADDNGWLLTVQSYESDAPDAMPRVLDVRRGALQIRLAIESWQL